jgi:uncharacterized RDD family membrane protein YckC
MPQHSDSHQPDDDHKEVTVETLRTPPLRISPAPVLKRLTACLVDSVSVGIIWAVMSFSSHQQLDRHLLVDAGYLALVTFAYYFLQEWLLSLTLGKRLAGLWVLGRTGDPLSIRESLIRNVIRFIDWLPAAYVLGGIFMAASGDRRRLGDVAARTVVTPMPKKDINPPPAPFLFH